MGDEKKEPERRDTVRGELEPEPVMIEGATGMLALNRAEIDIQIATAKRYPRSVMAFKHQALEGATLDEETAGTMFYALPRDGKMIEGPSVRLAEVVGSAWGNLRYGARIVDVSDRFVTAQGAAFDLEKNIACTVEVKRRITDRKGRRFTEDMVTVTQNAACSIALRQAIFKVVPFAYVKGIYDSARETAIGKALSMEQRRQRAIEWFGKLGIKPEKLLKLLGRKGFEDVSVDDLVKLRGITTALQDGEMTLETLLQEIEGGEEPRGPDIPIPAELAPLFDKLGWNTAAKLMFLGRFQKETVEQQKARLEAEVAKLPPDAAPSQPPAPATTDAGRSTKDPGAASALTEDQLNLIK